MSDLSPIDRSIRNLRAATNAAKTRGVSTTIVSTTDCWTVVHSAAVLRAASEKLRDELRSLQIAVGQASVEELDSVLAGADARFAEYCKRWAEDLGCALMGVEK